MVRSPWKSPEAKATCRMIRECSSWPMSVEDMASSSPIFAGLVASGPPIPCPCLQTATCN